MISTLNLPTLAIIRFITFTLQLRTSVDEDRSFTRLWVSREVAKTNYVERIILRALQSARPIIRGASPERGLGIFWRF